MTKNSLKKYLGRDVDYWPSWELFSQQATNSNSCLSRMYLVPQDSRGMCILWLKAAIVSSCCRKKYHPFNLSWSQPFSTGCLFFVVCFPKWNVHCFPIIMENRIGNKSFIKLNTPPQSKLWRPRVWEAVLKICYKDLSTLFPIPQPPPISLKALKIGIYKEIPEAWAFY